jgi:hypothetical protein
MDRGQKKCSRGIMLERMAFEITQAASVFLPPGEAMRLARAALKPLLRPTKEILRCGDTGEPDTPFVVCISEAAGYSCRWTHATRRLWQNQIRAILGERPDGA